MFFLDGVPGEGISPKGGFFYLVDAGARCIRMIDPDFRVVQSWSTAEISRYDEVRGIAFDGANFWISVATDQDSIYKVAALDGALIVLARFEAPPVGKGVVRDLAWDGSYLWALNSGAETDSIPARLYKIDPASGGILGEYDLPSAEPRALVYVGSNDNAYGNGPSRGFYYTDTGTDWVYYYDPVKRSGSQYLAAPVPPQGASYTSPEGLAWDGQAFWVVNTSSLLDHLFRVDYLGNIKASVELPFLNPGPIAWSRSDPRIVIPVVNAVSPNVGARDDTMAVTISGAFFLPGNGLRVGFVGGGIAVFADSTAYVSDTRIRTVIAIDADAALGERDVVVTNPTGKTGVGRGVFTVAESNPNEGFVWMGDQFNGIISKISVSDGAVVQQWSVAGLGTSSTSIQGLAYDGAHIWMSMAGTEDQIFELNTDGATLSVISAISAPPGIPDGVVRDIAFDGEGALWALNSDTVDGIQNLYKLDKTNGAILQTIPLPGTGTRGVTFAQGRLYIDEYSLDNIYVYDFVSGTWSVAFAMPVPPGGTTSNRYSTGMTWDGFNLWVANSTYAYDYLMQMTLTGQVLKSIPSPNMGDAQITGLTFTAR
jgi:sugar lactone lactonase YvrE